ncbi:hypothetical protein HDU76_001512, partial [Blyttiomyces sp. JEL0837]
MLSGFAVNGAGDRRNNGDIKYRVKVDHVASQQRIKIDVTPGSTLQQFLDEVAKDVNLDPNTITLFYTESGFRVKGKGDKLFQEALAETTMFTVEGWISTAGPDIATSNEDPILIRVTYDNITYAIEIKSMSLNQFNKEVCKQFAWNNDDLESMQLFYPSSGPQSAPVTIAPISVTFKPMDTADHDEFDVMLSYDRPEIDIYTVLNGVNSSVLLPQDSNNINDIQMFVHHQLSTQLSVEEAVDERSLIELVMRVTEKSSGVFHHSRLACKSLTETSHKSWNAVMEVANKFDVLNGVNSSVLLPQDSNNINDIQMFVHHQLSTQLSVEEAVDERSLIELVMRVTEKSSGVFHHSHLSASLERVFANADKESTARFQKVLGVIVTARVPLNQLSIAKLVGLTVAEVGGIILRIQSILSTSNGEIKVLHKSLKDFLSSKERCKNPLFYLDTVFFETIMASSCLQLMTAELTRNMAHLSDDTIPLPRFTTQVINPCLAYACKFWISHFLACSESRVLAHLMLFTSKSLLFWMEAGILMGNEIEQAAQKVGEFNTGTTVWRYSSAQQLLDDAAPFLWRFEDVISNNPLPIYSLGLEFTPKATKLYQTYKSARGMSRYTVKILNSVFEWGPLHKYLIGNSKRVSKLSCSNDGSILISSSTFDETVRRWGFKTQKEIHKLDNQVFGCMSNDGKLMATVPAEKGKVLIWDTGNWHLKRIIACIEVDYGALFAVFSPDSSTLAINSSDGAIRAVETGQQLKSIPTQFGSTDHYLSSAQISRDGKFIACGTRDGSVGVWNAVTGKQCFTSGGTKGVENVCFSGDGTKMLSASLDNNVILWDVETGRKIQHLQAEDLEYCCCAVSLDGRTAISSSDDDGRIALWDLTGKYKSDSFLPQTTWGRKHLISPDGKKIATGQSHNPVKSVCFAKNGIIAAFSFQDSETIVLNVLNGGVLARIPASGFVQSFSNNGLILASSKPKYSESEDGKVTLWNLTYSRVISSLDLDKSAVAKACFSRDGTLVATHADNCNEVVIWDVASGKELSKIRVWVNACDSIQFSSDNGRLLVAMNAQRYVFVREWDVNT